MKTIFSIFFLLFSIVFFGQSSKNQSDQLSPGTVLTVGGITFSVLAFTTSPDWIYQGSKQVDKPLHRQGAQTAAIVTGATLTITGLITSMSQKKTRPRRRN